MSQIYTYIATKTTYDRVIPLANVPQAQFNRTVALAFQDFSGGTVAVGELKQFPKVTKLENHLLCDGSEVSQAELPELYGYLGDQEGVAAAGMFKLPNFIGGTLDAAATAPAQTVEGGAVSSADDVVTTPSGAGEAGGSTGGAVSTGGRFPFELDFSGITP